MMKSGLSKKMQMTGRGARYTAKGYLLIAIALVTIGLSSRAGAASYTYNTSGIDGIAGFITTNCDNCTLNSNNIISWAFNPGIYGINIASSAAGSELDLEGNALVATPKAITFGFDPTPLEGTVFFKGQSGAVDFFTTATEASVYFSYPNGTGELDICGGGCSGDPKQGIQTVFGAATMKAPEIDSASWASAVSLLAGVLLVFRGRRPVFVR